ncbi:hypothetical protein PI124_g18119 [Phytophthora idaei]|nr:hypothetical protein PI125_g23344 [Phytophthora idaei]KAG3128546.1 hypothetical protein PI126_g21353 [Phytophthora idaei]KAG3236876.1 hypothetical protein PI124_g18119 [Phytophthora idaei]
MPSLTTLLSSLSFVLLAISTTQAAATSKWFEASTTGSDTKLLSSALEELSIYNPDIYRLYLLAQCRGSL